MVKVALYGLIRVVFEWLGATPVWLALLLLGLGALSALGGIAYALFQRELKRLLAFSTIENVGIILLGLGASLLFAASNQPVWATIAFAAALFHIANHALYKSLLFLGAGSFARIVNGLNLNRLGGLLRSMPYTGAGFLLGGMAIAGLPPLNGFASEWLTLQALIHLVTNSGDAVLGSLLPGASLGAISMVTSALCVAALAVTAALAAFCFIKVIGLTLLGPTRSEACAQAHEAPRGMVVGTSLLALLCVGLGLAPASSSHTSPASAPRYPAARRGRRPPRAPSRTSASRCPAPAASPTSASRSCSSASSRCSVRPAAAAPRPRHRCGTADNRSCPSSPGAPPASQSS